MQRPPSDGCVLRLRICVQAFLDGVLVGFAGASGGIEADDASGTLRVDADG
jgi:hypothetical protein